MLQYDGSFVTMIIEFSVENFLSIGKKITLSARTTREVHHRNRTYVSPVKGVRLVPLGVIYGPNASGKSNLFKALEFVETLITEGTKPGESIKVQPFRLEQARLSQPSKFSLQFLAGSRAYEYRFAVTASEVMEENLSDIGGTKEQLLFSRKLKNKETVFEFGSRLRKQDGTKERQFLEFVGKGTRGNQLFLREALEREVKQLSPVLDWFTKSLVLISPGSTSQSLELSMHSRQEFRDFCTNSVHRIDAGIESLQTEVVPLESARFPKELEEQVRSQVSDAENVFVRSSDGQRYNVTKINGEIRVARIVSYHPSADGGKPVRFEMPEESDGTQRFIDLLPAFHELGGMASDRVVVVDELDRSFHTALTRTLIKSYINAWRNTSRTQLIFTTHDATLLDHDLFRRDEIWLVEKNDQGETELKSLSDYSVRSDKRLMKDYLLGRYGAVPRIRPLRLGRASKMAEGASS